MQRYEVIKHFSNELNRETRLFIMLPMDYYKTSKSYPVLYMHDGQNLFDNKTATYNKSWDILSAYEKYDLPDIIIVGIDSDDQEGGQNRLDEYSPWKNNAIKDIYPDSVTRTVGGKGDAYLNYLVHTVKPFIENEYRVNTDPNLTGIAGSSMGGLISTYAVMKYNDHFSRCGAVSNAYWFSLEEIKKSIQDANTDHIHKFYMDVGTKEISRSNQSKDYYVNTNKEVYDVLKYKLDEGKLKFEIIEDGVHDELAWHDRVHDIINFLYSDI
jgi:predicted alpha/beta superfamily hydrolase